MTADTKPAGAMELKFCPFCGPGQSMVDPWFDDVSKRWAVGCGRCGASSGRSIHAEGSKEAAIKAWNTRALPAEAGVGTRVQNRLDAVEFCRAAFGPFSVDITPYVEIITELLDRVTARASPPPIRESSETTSSDGGNVKYGAELLALAKHHEADCARYRGNSTGCTTRRCLVRAGWKIGDLVDYSKATCEAHETAVALRVAAQPTQVQGEPVIPTLIPDPNSASGYSIKYLKPATVTEDYRGTVLAWLELYTSEQREIAAWLGLSPQGASNNAEWSKRIFDKVRETNQRTEFVEKVRAFTITRKDGGR